jgi:hypothetical protein
VKEHCGKSRFGGGNQQLYFGLGSFKVSISHHNGILGRKLDIHVPNFGENSGLEIAANGQTLQ